MNADGPAPSADAPAFDTQLDNAFVHELSAVRRKVTADDPSGPTVNALSPSAVMSEDREGFSVQWSVRVFAPTDAGEAVEINCTVEGQFSRDVPVDDELFSSFRTRESFILLWPYARSAVGEIARMLALDIPPLPTVDVRRFLRPRAEFAAEEPAVDEGPSGVPGG